MTITLEPEMYSADGMFYSNKEKGITLMSQGWLNGMKPIKVTIEDDNDDEHGRQVYKEEMH